MAKAKKKSKKRRASSVGKHYHSGASGYARRMSEGAAASQYHSGARGYAARMAAFAAGSAKKSRKKSRKKTGCPPATIVLRGKRLTTRGGVSKVSARALIAKAKGKRWTCAGPVRSGCGGSSSRVVGRVR